MVLMAGIDFPMSAVRQQLSRALDLIIQIERFNDGSRKVVNITEVQRMEGDTVTLQDIFEFRLNKDGDAKGQLVYTGLRPTCGKFERNGVSLPAYMDQHSFGAPGTAQPAAASAVTQANFGIRPGRVERRFGR
jgi:pilus assembly protein CpaF